MNSWGNYPKIDSRIFPFRSERDLATLLAEKEHLIPYGLGRSYGDSALAANQVVSSRYNRLLSFDDESGLLVCEAGVSLGDIVEVFAPNGWFLPVTPGTKFVTVGGAIASDVHGKNHHKEGCFSDHVAWLKLMLADGSSINASPEQNSDIFHATCGGMGLTGFILEAAFYLRRIETPWISQHSRRMNNLQEVMEALEASEQATYSVAWIDCVKTGNAMGRSVLMTGEHTAREQAAQLGSPKAARQLSVPLFFPGWALNPLSVRAFNTLYYRKAPIEARQLVTFNQFFYPLDAVDNWNRIYGRRGFLQYQFVLPREAGHKGLEKVFSVIAASGQGSFLAVLKLLGKENRSLLGFPREGWTLALDFPVGSETFKLLDHLDALVLDYGGRFYLTKDARMTGETFRRCYKNLDLFLAIKNRLDPNGCFASLQSDRLGLT